MKKVLWLVILGLVVSFPSFAKKEETPELRNDRVYVMYLKSCPMCQKALTYIDKKYPNSLFIVKVDLATMEGRAMMQQCRKKHELKDIIVPMVCAGDDFTMGWSRPNEEKFDNFMEKLSY